jgi:hypothetical protein
MRNRLSIWPLGLKGTAGAVTIVMGLGIVYFGPGVGTESPKKEASATINRDSLAQQKKPVRAMNVALGDMVFLAQDLGFHVADAKGAVIEPNKIAARIEGQIQGIREIYRQEVAKNSSLVGAIILQLDIAASGEVTHAKEVSSRLADTEFRKSILAEAAKWSFSEIAGENLTATCPLLFVREGMDITTLVRWEKSLGSFPETGDTPRLAANGLSAPQSKSPADVTPVNNVSTDKVKTNALAKPEGKEFQIKYATSLRRDPNFSAPSLTTFTIGTKVRVLKKQGDWLEVRATHDGPSGFIRKEFVTQAAVVAHR